MDIRVRPTHRLLISMARDGRLVYHGDGYAFRVRVMRGRRLTYRYEPMTQYQFDYFDGLVRAGVLTPAARDKPVELDEDAAHVFLRGPLADSDDE